MSSHKPHHASKAKVGDELRRKLVSLVAAHGLGKTVVLLGSSETTVLKVLAGQLVVEATAVRLSGKIDRLARRHALDVAKDEHGVSGQLAEAPIDTVRAVLQQALRS